MTFSKHAIITGGCSGIGYNLVKHLYQKQEWRIVVADIRPEAWDAISSEFSSEKVIFVKVDVASWDDNARLFKEAFAWSQGRIDFFAANAGTGDKEMIYGPQDLDAEPVKPNLFCVEVNEISIHYGLKLFVYYSRKTQRSVKESSSGPPFNPKMVITASCVGQYPFPVAPQYNASKHACVGLTRSVGGPLYAQDNIAVNCIMPAFIATQMVPAKLLEVWPKEWITPFSTLNRAYDELISDNGIIEQDGRSDGVDGEVKRGQSVEVSCQNLFYRKPVEYADESQRFLIEEAIKPDGLWVTKVAETLKEMG
jgi:15-hydroxyprostaglandin dehydrogenase (NAD)